MIVPVDLMIKMIECCYFTGCCKLCPFYKAPKFGVIGACVGQKKVGQTLLDWFIQIKIEEQAEQLKLFDPDKNTQEADEFEQDPAEAAQDPDGSEQDPAEATQDPDESETI